MIIIMPNAVVLRAIPVARRLAVVRLSRRRAARLTSRAMIIIVLAATNDWRGRTMAARAGFSDRRMQEGGHAWHLRAHREP